MSKIWLPVGKCQPSRAALSKVHNLRRGNDDWVRDDILENLNLQSWTQNGSRQYWTVHNGYYSPSLNSPDSSPRGVHFFVAQVPEEATVRSAPLPAT